MSSWGNTNNAANTPYWSATMVKRAPTAAEAALLYQNTTPNAYITNETVGVWGIDAAEADVAQAHTGWVLNTKGSGGRAGRVQTEVLVALSTMNAGAGTPTYPETKITITSQPASNSAHAGAGNTVSFSVAASADPAASLSYYWQFNNGAVWANTSTGGTLFLGNTSPVLVANAQTTTANTYVVRCVVGAAGTGAADQVSANATITIL